MIRYISIFFILIPSICFASSMKMIGEKGKIENVTRVINVKMFDNYYEPNTIKVKAGETIKFVVKNMGELVHELNIATKEMHIKHQPEMAKMVEHGILLADKVDKNKMKEMAKLDHAMAHKHANSVLLEPNKTGEIIWKFSSSAKLEVACNVPGHYETGMVAKIIQD
ncbi:cupredoxin domain-containing protein [Pelagibacteraceae bacterium]|nr:cupredoxin domain-containing protein [Pelagibacteraceae bacterium]